MDGRAHGDRIPVARYRLVSSVPDEAIEHLRAAYTHIDTSSSLDEGFEFSLEGVSAGAVDLAALRHSTPLVGACEPPERLVSTVGASSAQSRVSHGREEARGSVLLAPAVPYEMETRTPLDTATVALDRAEVARVGAQLFGLDPVAIVFHAMTPRSAGLGRYWARLVAHLHRAVSADEDLLAEPLLHAEVVRQLATGLLVVFPNTGHTVHTSPRRETGDPAVVRRAVDFVDAHAHEPITPTEIAAAAGISVRGLQQSFARHRASTPHRYLRQVRLERAHAELVAADPRDGDTVAGVAARWGFANPGRFAGDYRIRFGLLPSVTLHR